MILTKIDAIAAIKVHRGRFRVVTEFGPVEVSRMALLRLLQTTDIDAVPVEVSDNGLWLIVGGVASNAR